MLSRLGGIGLIHYSNFWLHSQCTHTLVEGLTEVFFQSFRIGIFQRNLIFFFLLPNLIRFTTFGLVMIFFLILRKITSTRFAYETFATDQSWNFNLDIRKEKLLFSNDSTTKSMIKNKMVLFFGWMEEKCFLPFFRARLKLLFAPISNRKYFQLKWIFFETPFHEIFFALLRSLYAVSLCFVFADIRSEQTMSMCWAMAREKRRFRAVRREE